MQNIEEALLERVKSGDEQAFAKLVETHLKRVYNTAFRMCGSKEDAEDITQEVFIKIYRSLHSFKGESSFSTFLYRVTVNCSVDFMRKSAGGRTVSLTPEEEGTPELQLPSPGAAPETLLLEKERLELIMAEIAALPEQQRAVIVLREFNGLSYEEIAAALELSIGTVKSRMVRARARLKKRLLSKGTLFSDFLSNGIEKGGKCDDMR